MDTNDGKTAKETADLDHDLENPVVVGNLNNDAAVTFLVETAVTELEDAALLDQDAEHLVVFGDLQDAAVTFQVEDAAVLDQDAEHLVVFGDLQDAAVTFQVERSEELRVGTECIG